MNIIIVGCGKVGNKIAERLSCEAHHNITVIDIRGESISDAISMYDIMGVTGSGVNVDVLRDAGVETADILIAVTGSDEINLFTCLLAKKLGDCQTIARVRKPEYNNEISLFKEDLGLAMVINPELTAAMEIARILRFPSAIQIDTFAKGRVEILKFRITENCAVKELRIADVRKKFNCDVLVCGVERDGEAFIPKGDFILKTNDRVSIVASIKNAADFFKKIGIKTNRVKDTMIVGGGSTAYYLAKILLQSGVDVKIIEKDAKRCEHLCELLPKATIINGDGTDNRLLLESGLSYAESFVSLINIDEENILLSLFAKNNMAEKGKVITKINRIDYGSVISSLDLDSIIYPKNITAEYIVRFVRAKHNSIGSNIETMHLILDGKAEALEFNIGSNSPVSDVPLEKLNIKENALVVCINRNGKIIIPHGKDSIKKGDTVIIVTTITGLTDISDILK